MISRGLRAERTFVADAQPVHRAGREVLHDDVDLLDEAEEERLALGVAEVDGDRALAAVDAEEVAAPAVLVGAGGAGDVAARRALDLDHVRAEVAKDHRGVGPGEDPGEVEDA